MSIDSGRLLVLTYHYIRDAGGGYPGIHPITSDEFSDQIYFLKKHLHPATVREVEDFLIHKIPLEKDAFFLTFDDGLIDHYDAAQSVLSQHNMKGAFFIPTRPLEDLKSPAVQKIHWLRAHTPPSLFIKYLKEFLPSSWNNIALSSEDKKRAAAMHIHDEPDIQALKFALNFLLPYDVVDKVMSKMLSKFNLDEKKFCDDLFMNEIQIKKLNDAGHIIGLHGHTHAPLSLYSNNDAKKDVLKNSKKLYSIIDEKPKWMSYPYGRPDALPNDTKKFCSDCEVDIAFTLMSGFNEFGGDNTSLKRITPNELPTFFNI